MNEQDNKYYTQQQAKHLALATFIGSASWELTVGELTDNLREVLEQIYEAAPKDAGTNNKVEFRFEEGRASAVFNPFHPIIVDYDVLLDKPNVEITPLDEHLTAVIELEQNGVKLQATVQAKIPKEIMGFMEDCGLVMTESYAFESRSFVCNTGLPF